MGKPTQELTARNQSIYNDFKAGVSYVDMVHKYQLSSQRLWQIIKREEYRENAPSELDEIRASNGDE